MKISGIKSGLPFKALYISDENNEHIKKIVNPNRKELEQMAKDKIIYIESGEATVVQGSDYTISKPVLNVEILPNPVQTGKEKFELKEKYNIVMGTSFIYVPTTKNEKENKFMEVMRKSLSLIG